MFSGAVFVALFFVGMLSEVDAYPGKRKESCSASYLRLGCFNDNHIRGVRPMQDLLFTDRDTTSDKFSGVAVDWNNWDAYIKGAVCRCAERAKAKGYMFFGLQFYGECWASKEFTFNINGMGEGCTSFNHGPCTFSSSVCVGEQFSLFVYNVRQ